jgi:hypothetical protein
MLWPPHRADLNDQGRAHVAIISQPPPIKS